MVLKIDKSLDFKADRNLILKADRIITGDGKTVLDNGAVCISEDKITDVADFSVIKGKFPDAKVVEYPGHTILPGMIDMHVHVGYKWNHPDTAGYNDFLIAYLAADYAKAAFSKGVTTIRDATSPKNLCASMVIAARKGYIEVPRIIHADEALCFTGGHDWEHSNEVNGPWNIRAAIRDAVKRGADWIKIMASHRTDTPEYTQEELDAAVHESHRLGKKIAVHAGTQPSIQMCIDAGFDTIEHGTYLTVKQAGQMAEKGIVWVPTIVAYTSTYERIAESMQGGCTIQADFIEHYEYFRRAAEAYRNNFEALYRTGVKIVTGTDVVYAGREVTPIAEELRYMTSYGMPVLEAIRAATKSGAETLGLDDITGEIAAGKQADLVIVEGNPLEDICVMRNVREVCFGGKRMSFPR